MSYTYLKYKVKSLVIDYIQKYLPKNYIYQNITNDHHSRIEITNLKGNSKTLDLIEFEKFFKNKEFELIYMIENLFRYVFDTYGLCVDYRIINYNIQRKIRNINILPNLYICINGNKYVSIYDELNNEHIGVKSFMSLVLDPIQCINKIIGYAREKNKQNEIDIIINTNLRNIHKIIEDKIYYVLVKSFLFKIQCEYYYVSKDIFNYICLMFLNF